MEWVWLKPLWMKFLGYRRVKIVHKNSNGVTTSKAIYLKRPEDNDALDVIDKYKVL